MESSTGANEGAGEEERNVRRRLSSPTREVEEKKKQKEHSVEPSSTREPVPSSSPFEKKAVSGLFYIVTEEGAWRKTVCHANSSQFAEAERCWEEHRTTGKMHHEPPWRVCSVAEDNREHPYYVRWLDTMELPPLEELLNKKSGSDGATEKCGGDGVGK
ncbi:hypothetical protein C3747_41g230 [Trypanosoma cruzi]|uniref:Uncharacterized protein n=2 Tax=Trypanosoma cruzi TaxID=5693 RepID=Q4E0T0_TRYCC|nr:hypothetical protein, conserved [Trypanosoma cruzi]EAN98395.1 hypothetical protein, conserved [Trypanosoma cruzi]KAF8294936.1 hypothetical protein TcYC6_0095940 [Trypanosoma cruzi]PWV13738.1 hypothetical protein C3747_41g230 [Trypanosoma cruzi]RNC52825.1 hypothetical protein TcCL_ESM09899 [Trypanosoma cruzi]|eukprot:XP_820246.1 hypothetical protein [Trypanosoma cruzi strain CL Brener]